MLLDDLNEAREVELGEEGKIMHIGHERGDLVLQLSEPLFHLVQAHPGIASFAIVIIVVAPSVVVVRVADVPLDVPGRTVCAVLVTFFVLVIVVDASDKLDHLFLKRNDALEQLIRLVPLEALALLQLLVQGLEELLLGSVGPGEVGLDLLLERSVRDVLVCPL